MSVIVKSSGGKAVTFCFFLDVLVSLEFISGLSNS